MNLNKVILVGRVTADPQVRQTQAGQSVTTFSLATNRVWTDKSGKKQEESQFHNIVIWGRLAEVAGSYLIKGSEVLIEGRLATREYTDKQGTVRKITEVVADGMQLGAKPQNTTSPSRSHAEQDEEILPEDLPF